MSAEAIARLREARPVFNSTDDTVVKAADLRALLDACDTAHARGVADERARVVVDLLECSKAVYAKGEHRIGAYVESLADRYAVGEHEEGT